MDQAYFALTDKKTNIAFLGEAGCGKSEIALNFALRFAAQADRQVHFFDLDQTKPLFRSRDAGALLEKSGIALHYEQQYLDAPTVVGGVAERLKSPDCYTLLDIGGGTGGARMVGGFAPFLNAGNTKVFYVVNPFRPWSREVLAIDKTLSAILKVSHVKNFHVLCNPNLGQDTTAAELLAGYKKTQAMLGEYVAIEAVCVWDALYEAVRESIDIPLLPLQLHLRYEWAT